MRNGIRLTVAVVALCVSTVAAVLATAPAADMVRHGGFEDGEAAGIGKGWVSESYGTGTWRFNVVEDKAREGKYCQHIQVENHQKGGAQVCQLGMKLKKGEEYSVSLWLRGNVSVPVRVGLRKHVAPYTYYVKQEVGVTPGWQKYTITGVATDNDDDAGLYIFFAGSGDLWIDGVSMQAKAPAVGEKVAAK